MSTDNPNAWAVMFRKPPDTEWSIQTWYPSVTVTHINGNVLSEESQFDIGEARASQEATRMNNVWRSGRIEDQGKLKNFLLKNNI